MARSARHEIEELRRQIEHHNYKYYVEAAPEISDRDFDRLMQRLQELASRPRHPGQSDTARWRTTHPGVSPSPPPCSHVVHRQHL